MNEYGLLIKSESGALMALEEVNKHFGYLLVSEEVVVGDIRTDAGWNECWITLSLDDSSVKKVIESNLACWFGESLGETAPFKEGTLLYWMVGSVQGSNL